MSECTPWGDDAPDGLSKEELALVLSPSQIKRLLDEHGADLPECTKGWTLQKTRDYLGY
jgi:hypothetical protein